MDKLILENVRCFGTRQEAPLAPLTVLVGENNTGKTTFLAAVRIARELTTGWPVDFNQEPFHLGAYDQIATNHGGKDGRASSFRIGQETLPPSRGQHDTTQASRMEACFAQSGSQPILSSLEISDDGYSVVFRFGSGSPIEVAYATPEESQQKTVPVSNGYWRIAISRSADFALSPHAAINAMRDSVVAAGTSIPEQIRDLVWGVFMPHPPLESVFAFAPVRSRPQRTYNPITDEPDAEGQHVPMLLARLLRSSNEEGARLRDSLIEFGKASGLFTDISVRRLGEDSDPFQILVGPPKLRRNLVDVGYGVSQVLPILVEILNQPKGKIFLIQQPEVHLHPRAQAALATLFAQLVKERGCQLIVETHSDYFIDRLRMDIRDSKGLRPEQISLLYFELDKKGNSTIYPLKLDDRGAILDPPPGYRSFFLQEELRYFGVD